jgi:Ca2+-transporting ATPase
MLSPAITVLRSGAQEEVEVSKLVPGDILLLEAGDRVPADARIVENHSLVCDEASLTGESVTVHKDLECLSHGASTGDRKNMVFAGTTVVYGRGKAAVTATGMNSVLGKIAGEVAALKTDETPLEKRTAEIGKWLSVIALSVCALVACASIVRAALFGSIDFPFIVTVIMFAVSLAVAAVPEALAAIVTGALAIGMRQMAKRNALIRKMPAVETLGCTTVICTDKTGTLTKGEMTVRKIYTGRTTIEVTGAGYSREGRLEGADEASGSLEALLTCGILCSDSAVEADGAKWSVKGDPTEAALLIAAAKRGLDPALVCNQNPREEEIPFSSERKRMTTIHRTREGKRIAYMKGAPESVLSRCTRVMSGDAVVSLSDYERGSIGRINEGMALDALRVIGFAFRELQDSEECAGETIETGMIFVGLAGMIDPPREEAVDAIRVCREVHIKPIMITGDHRLTALAIAKEIGIFRNGDLALTGEELEAMPDEEFEQKVSLVTVYARVSPMDKLRIVRAWKKRGDVVAMTGDGVNDAPALKHADIGIAMGITGTEVAKEASDMVLADDNFATIVAAIERGRWIYDNIKKYLAYLLQCNITEVIVIGGIVLVMGPEFLPLFPASILYMNLATDGLPALALGVSPPDPDVMKRPPRNPKESIFGWDVKSFLIRAVLIECPFFFFIFFLSIADILRARTELFFLFIVIEFVISLNCRSLVYSVFKAPPHKWLLFALGWEILLINLLIQIPSIRDAFGIAIPSLPGLGVILGFGILIFVIIEIMKVFLRRSTREAKSAGEPAR